MNPANPNQNATDEATMAVWNKIRYQNVKYFEVYDYIIKNVPRDDQIDILNFNGQMVSDTDEQVSSYSSVLQMRN